MANYIREAQLFIGPLTEVEGGGDQNQAIVIKSSGLSTEQRIEFRVNKNTMGAPNFSEITIYNLTESTKQIIARPGTNIVLQAGYQQGDIGLQTLAQGAVASTIGERDAGDKKVTINAFDGQQGMGLGKFSKSYQGQVQLAKIVKDVAASLPGVSVQDSDIALGAQQVGSKGLVLAGRSANLLDRLSHQWGFSWSVQNGAFKAIPDQATSGNTFVLSSATGNLKQVTPRIDNVLQTVTGIEISAVLDPRIQPYDNVTVMSNVSPDLNNTYKVTNITHQGDTHGQQWTSTIQCLFNLGQVQQNQDI